MEFTFCTRSDSIMNLLLPSGWISMVITNTNLIADMIETMSPVRPDKCPPVIEDSDRQLGLREFTSVIPAILATKELPTEPREPTR